MNTTIISVEFMSLKNVSAALGSWNRQGDCLAPLYMCWESKKTTKMTLPIMNVYIYTPVFEKQFGDVGFNLTLVQPIFHRSYGDFV